MAGYLIHEILHFDPETAALTNVHEPEFNVVLNPAASKCLFLLLSRHGQVLTREELIDAGWGESGLVVTENSLNQTISYLRRTFRQLRLQMEIILTTTRLGYRINSDVKIEKIEPGLSVDAVEKPVTKSGAFMSWPLFLLAGVIVLALCIYSYTVFFPNNVKIDYIETQSPYESHHLFIQVQLKDKTAYLADAVKKLKSDKELSVLVDTSPYIYINNTIRKDVFSYFLCTADISSKKNGCRSYTMAQVN